ncbi:MAG: hypothetical protein COA38_19950 [Fluviicola sp.]|nr:MAG: hypothetical protein COA38_19950 [Fluviicola sp.]
MKTILLLTRWRILNEINLIEIGLKSILIALMLINYSSGFAQQKVINQQEWQQKLIEVNENIQEIDQSIAIINARIAGVPSENIDPSVQVRLNDLQIRKEQYTREKISIEAVLNTSENSLAPSQESKIAKSTFLSLPRQNQDLCLVYSERYIVIENL